MSLPRFVVLRFCISLEKQTSCVHKEMFPELVGYDLVSSEIFLGIMQIICLKPRLYQCRCN